jgi:hypothetical protein
MTQSDRGDAPLLARIYVPTDTYLMALKWHWLSVNQTFTKNRDC